MRGQQMQTGVILNYHEDKGHGFLRPDDGRGPADNLFFHHKVFRPQDVTPRKGARVMFIEGMDDRSGRTRAIYVEEA
jgi:cold shock CspA family protein